MAFANKVALLDSAGADLEGQGTMAASVPVVIASDQSAIPIAGAVAISGTVPVSVADGSDVAEGAVADAIVAAGAAGTLSAKLRRVTQGLEDLKTLIAIASIIPGVGATNLGKAEDAVAASGDTGVAMFALQQAIAAALNAAGDYTLLQVDSQNRLWTTGQVAHDSPVSGAPFRVGGRARTTEMGAVASDDAVDALYDEFGKQIVLSDAIPSKWVSGLTAAITGTSDTEVIAAPGASLYLNITSVTVTCSHATVGTVVELKSATTAKIRHYAAALGGGFTILFKTPLKLAVNVAFNAANITTASNVYVSAVGFISGN